MEKPNQSTKICTELDFRNRGDISKELGIDIGEINYLEDVIFRNAIEEGKKGKNSFEGYTNQWKNIIKKANNRQEMSGKYSQKEFLSLFLQNKIYHIAHIFSNIQEIHKEEKESFIKTLVDELERVVKVGFLTEWKDRGNGYTAFYSLMKNGYRSQAERLLTLGANINNQDKNDLSALCSAAREGRLEDIQFLLEHKADVSIGGNEDLNPEQYISKYEPKSLAEAKQKQTILGEIERIQEKGRELRQRTVGLGAPNWCKIIGNTLRKQGQKDKQLKAGTQQLGPSMKYSNSTAHTTKKISKVVQKKMENPLAPAKEEKKDCRQK